ncbi:MAG: D-amino-acid transaminase [Gammaproteobacteria bacterium]|nr:D-amino-acid transaminase [Gammaproteobacteria bacterium]
MNRTVYVNGEFLPESDAKISIFDRGFIFSDGVYEVSSVLGGKLIENAGHLARLRRSLNELDMPSPASDEEIEAIQNKLIELNAIDQGLVYLQVTRGAADREFTWSDDMKPSLVMFTQAKELINSPTAEKGISVITTPDIRWQRRDIKTIGLLAPCMAKMLAKSAGADDAWQVDEDGFITEGSSNNAYIVDADGVIVTRQLSQKILHGITRKAILKLAEESTIRVEERPFSVDEALNASEAFISSASTFVWPVISIDGQAIGTGQPGPVARRLREIYIKTALESTR